QASDYVVTRSWTLWTRQQQLIADDRTSEDLFGFSVAISGDTVVAGAPLDVNGANTSQGSAYVFTRIGEVWTKQQKLTPNDGAGGAHFGFSVALSGDTVVVGAVSDDIAANADQGSAYIFTRSGADWTQREKLIATDGAAKDNFGVSVALSGDTVAVGAVKDDVGANADQGSAYVFVCPNCPTITLNPELLPDGVVGDSYSQTVTASGGGAPYSFTLSAGSLPTGLSLAANGALSGPPTVAGSFNFTVQATDANGCQGARSYALTVKTADCVFQVSRTNFAFTSNGGSGEVSVSAGSGSAWTAAANDPFIRITS